MLYCKADIIEAVQDATLLFCISVKHVRHNYVEYNEP